MNMDSTFNLGDTLLIELISGQKIQGEYRESTDRIIYLINAKDAHLKQNVGSGFYTLRKRDVSQVKVISKTVETDKKLCTRLTIPTVNVLMDESEYGRLEKLCRNFTYISDIEDDWTEAIEYLHNCENISCVALGNVTIDLLVICSWNQAYIFDTNKEIRFISKLKPVLESNYVKKIVHNSRDLVDCLFNQHGVNLKNIFDTGVADVITTQGKHRNVMECLVHYFNFPSHLFSKELTTEMNRWSVRPLEKQSKIDACKLAAYLIPLKNYLMENHILSSYYKTVNSFANLIQKRTAFVPFGLANNTVDIEEIGLTD